MRGKRSRTSFTKEDKVMIAKARGQVDIFGGIICRGCGRSFPIDIMEVDHINPFSKHGSDAPRNLQLLCPACNRRKASKKPNKPKPLIRW
jgi:5-methylcytosine-specific restriction endonuclease McrA